jgi:hypothetical protein
VDGVPPGKLHDHEVGEQDERFVNVTVPPTVTVVGVPEKSAITPFMVI